MNSRRSWKTVSTYNSQVLITGDFNIHVDLSSDIHADRLNSLISDYDLVQCVQEATHVLGHTLDLVIVRSDCAISNLLVDPPSLSDHGIIHYSIPFLYHQPVYAMIETRGLEEIGSRAVST